MADPNGLETSNLERARRSNYRSDRAGNAKESRRRVDPRPVALGARPWASWPFRGVFGANY